MGIRICYPSGEVFVVRKFTDAESKQHTIKMWCDVQTNEHNLVFSKSPIKKQAAIVIEFSFSDFRTLVAMGTKHLNDFFRKIKAGRSLSFSPRAFSVNAEMHRCIYNITHYNGSDVLKVMYVYSHIIELLMLQQMCYEQLETSQPIFVKNDYDRERIIFARDYLLTHLDAPPSLPELAGIAGINEFKLKRGFRELFNHSVFGYLADVRLQMARTALKQNQKSISQIAFELGYASLQHFSAAFKKKFGVSPRVFVS